MAFKLHFENLEYFNRSHSPKIKKPVKASFLYKKQFVVVNTVFVISGLL